MTYLTAYFATLTVFVICDMAWLGTMASRLYRPTLGDIMLANVNLPAGVAFYLIYPIGLVIFALMGLAPLFGWRKTSPEALKKAFIAPTIAFVTMYVLHVAVGSSLRDAMVTLSNKRFGCVCIVDDNGLLAGIITDGDLARNLDRNLGGIAVDEIMTRTPKTVDPDALTVEAMRGNGRIGRSAPRA